VLAAGTTWTAAGTAGGASAGLLGSVSAAFGGAGGLAAALLGTSVVAAGVVATVVLGGADEPPEPAPVAPVEAPRDDEPGDLDAEVTTRPDRPAADPAPAEPDPSDDPEVAGETPDDPFAAPDARDRAGSGGAGPDPRSGGTEGGTRAIPPGRPGPSDGTGSTRPRDDATSRDPDPSPRPDPPPDPPPRPDPPPDPPAEPPPAPDPPAGQPGPPLPSTATASGTPPRWEFSFAEGYDPATATFDLPSNQGRVEALGDGRFRWQGPPGQVRGTDVGLRVGVTTLDGDRVEHTVVITVP
jgi:hypothetical protein